MDALHRLSLAAAVAAGISHLATAAPVSSSPPPGLQSLGRPASDAPGPDRASPAGSALPLMREGLSALTAGALDAAAASFNAAASTEPNAPGPRLGLAEVALRRGDAVAAEAEIRRAVSTAPSSVLAHAALARLFVRKGDPSGAVGEYTIAIHINPRDPTLPVECGDVQALALGRVADAIASYRQAIAADAGYAPAHYELGRVLLRSGQAPGGRAELRIATRLAPDNAMAWAALGRAELLMNDPAAAVAAADTALRLAPSLADAQIGRGDALAAAGRSIEALTAYDGAASNPDTASVALVRRGVLQRELGQAGAALGSFRAAVAANPSDPDAQNDLAYTLAQSRQDLDTALAAARKAVSLAAAVPLYKDTLGWVYRARGDLALALETLKPLAAGTASPEIDYHLGMVVPRARPQVGCGGGAAGGAAAGPGLQAGAGGHALAPPTRPRWHGDLRHATGPAMGGPQPC